MSYKMSYKVRSLLFFFAFLLTALLYDSMDEGSLVSIDEPKEAVERLSDEELVKNQLDTETTIVNID